MEGLPPKPKRKRSKPEHKMPTTPDSQVAVPNAFIRSALFSATDNTKQRAFKHEEIASLNGTKIYYTGWQLNQGHLDVFESVVHKARGYANGEILTFSAGEILSTIGRHNGKYEHDWLYKKLIELSANALVIVKDGDKFFNSSILRVPEGSLVRGLYKIEITNAIIALFYPNYTIINWEHRHKLKKKPLAAWLHAFIGSHREPYDITVKKMHELCGSEAGELWKFREGLRRALKELTTIGAIYAGDIGKGDKVLIQRFPPVLP